MNSTTIPFSLTIQADTGVNLFSISEGIPPLNNQANSLLQAFSQSSQEVMSGGAYGVGNPQIIKSKIGLIAFTSMTFKGENQIMIFLATKAIA